MIDRHRGIPLILSVALFTTTPALAATLPPGDAARGKQVFALAGGCSCHTMKDGPVGAGGAEVATPFGKFYGTNITPDRTSGIGAWSDDEIDAAIRQGWSKERGSESPVMPYYWYSGMSDRDAADLIAYLRTLSASDRPSRPHEGELPLARWSYFAWKWLFAEMSPRIADAPASGVERGRYLADHVSLCADCHTPRTALGAVDASMYMAGTNEGPGGNPVPNITPHATGIADWDEADIATVLRSGMMPDFDNVQGAMGEVVDGVGGGPGYKDAPDEDRKAIAAYLLTVPPVDHKVDDE